MQSDIEWNPGPVASTSTAGSKNFSGLTIFHVNARSVRNKIEELYDLLEGTNIICFTETHLDDTVSQDSITFDGYNEPFRKDFNNRSGGILLYCMSDLDTKRREDLETNIDECIWIEINLKHKRYLLCTLYRQRDLTLNFWNALESSISRAFDETDNVILNGDWNIDFLKPLPQVVHDLLNLYGLKNIIAEPTRFGQFRNSLLDPVLVSDSITAIDSGVIPVERHISDHDGVFIIVNSPILNHPSFTRDIWLHKLGNYELLRTKLNQINWQNILQNTANVDLAAELFTNMLISVAKTCITVKTVEIRPHDKPWFNSKLRTAVRIRERLRKRALQTKTLNDHYKSQ